MERAVLQDRRVLVVDADRDVREVVTEVLEGVGAKAHPCSSVDEAILSLRVTRFDALVVEANLWLGRNALLADTTSRLQPDAGVVLTGEWESSAPPPDELTLLEKPFSPRRLMDALRDVVSARSARPH